MKLAANPVPLTREDLRQIPKVELHRHLELSLRHSTLREIAPLVGIEVPPTDEEFKRQLLITQPMADLESVLKKFLNTRAVLHSEEILARITFEAIEDSVKEGIKILELRYAPTFVNGGHPSLDFERIHRSIMKGKRLAESQGLPIAVGLIVLIQRILPVEVAATVTDFAIDHKDDVVGLDLADNEQGSKPEPFAPHFQRAKKAGLHITVHSGEDNFPGAAENVRTAIEKLGAERIGHGVQIYKSPEVMKFVRDQKVALELCPTSNWLTSAVASTAVHPFRQLMEAGVAVTLNSDDPGIFDIDLVNEYEVLAREHAFTREEFDRVNDTAAAFSFLPLAAKQKH
jgi:adenosine deaminase